MEERLFWIGIVMGAYAWASNRWKKSGAIDSAAKAGAWHGLFCAIAGFSITLVVVMSMESRTKFISIAADSFSSGEVYPSLVVALLAGIVGFWRAATEGRSAKKREYYLAEDWEWSETVFSAVLLASVLMYCVVQAFKIPSGSMRMTFLEGDHLFVNKFIYGLRVPFKGTRIMPLRSIERKDIVVFRFPSDNPQEAHCGSIQYGKDFIKRVIGLPGETVAVKDGKVFINGQLLADEPYAQYLDAQRAPSPAYPRELTLPIYNEYWQNHELDRRIEEMQRDNPYMGSQKDYFGPVTVPKDAYFVMGDNRDRSCDSRYWGPVEKKYLKGKAWFIYWPPSRMGGVR
jgi:signal peptidase I